MSFDDKDLNGKHNIPPPPQETKSQARTGAKTIISNVFQEALSSVIPEVVQGHDFKPQPNPPPNISPDPNQLVKKSSSDLFKTPPGSDEFHTPPISPENSKVVKSSYTKVLFRHDDQGVKEAESRRAWHEKEVEKTIRNTERMARVKEEAKEYMPLRNTITDRNMYEIEDTPLLNERKSIFQKVRSSLAFNCIQKKHYYMSSKFSNRDFRHHFASKMFLYKAIHMFFGNLAAIFYQATWTWEREIKNLGPPDLVRFVDNNYWIAFIVLSMYVSLAIVVRVFEFGRNMPFTWIVYIGFTSLFGIKCYCACVGLGQLGAAIITTVTYTLCISYSTFAIFLAMNKYPEKLDLMQDYIYRILFYLVVVISPFSWLLTFLELELTGSIFQKSIGLGGSILEDYLPSFVIAYVILVWEIFRVKGILEGSVVSLPEEDEYLFAAFFI